MRLSVVLALSAVAVCAQERDPVPAMPKLSAEDLAKGERLFNGHCAPCHGPKGDGGKGANLARPKLPRAVDDSALFRVIRDGIQGTEMPGAWEMIDREVWQTAAYVKTLGRVAQQMVTGDAIKGSQLYEGKGCAACHIVNGKGGRTGPELSQIGMRRSPGHLRESLVSPAAEAPEDFAWVRLVDRMGAKVEGVRLNEDTFSIQVRDTKDRIRSYWKRDLKQIDTSWKTSPMPSFSKTLSESELGDLVAYLASLGGVQ
jgi:putative heme-binding domain-containing protein